MTTRLCAQTTWHEGQAIDAPIHANPDGASLIVLRSGGRVHAFLNICPHAGRPLNWAPGRFLYSLGQLVCAAHGASFRPEDGYCIGGPCGGSRCGRWRFARSMGRFPWRIRTHRNKARAQTHPHQKYPKYLKVGNVVCAADNVTRGAVT